MLQEHTTLWMLLLHSSSLNTSSKKVAIHMPSEKAAIDTPSESRPPLTRFVSPPFCYSLRILTQLRQLARCACVSHSTTVRPSR
jgi:hypothetical protein